METRVQIVAIAATAGLFVLVFELVRRRRLLERYALLWLFASVILLGLSIWRGLLEELAQAVGIFYAPSALFAVAFGFVLVLLLHFSLVISRLAEQTKVLATVQSPGGTLKWVKRNVATNTFTIILAEPATQDVTVAWFVIS